MDGIDEDHCEELEYNECGDHQYRCDDGSCIAEEYWLDGEYDCSDRSDEPNLKPKSIKRNSCSLISSEFDCDEATSSIDYFPCGDGEFVLERIFENRECYNYRMSMFFCELKRNLMEGDFTWTLHNGHCVEKGWLEKNLTDLNESEICVLYLKCQLTNGKTDICEDIIPSYDSLCKNQTIIYPSEPTFYPYAKTVYILTGLTMKTVPAYVLFNGSIKCADYPVSYELHSSLIKWVAFVYQYPYDILFCDRSNAMNMGKYCSQNTKQSFACQLSWKCISKYRLRNGIVDCRYVEDESDDQTCHRTEQFQYRLQCSGDPSKCLSIGLVGSGYAECKEYDDESIVQLKRKIFNYPCIKRNSMECSILRNYIRSRSSISPLIKDRVIRFRRYCDSFFHLAKGIDESLCHEWKCP